MGAFPLIFLLYAFLISAQTCAAYDFYLELLQVNRLCFIRGVRHLGYFHPALGDFGAMPGPYGTCKLHNKFYNAGGKELPANYFASKGRNRFVIKPELLSKIYPKQIAPYDEVLIGIHGVYYYPPANRFRTLGDTKRVVPQSYIEWDAEGGFKIKSGYLKFLYPPGFELKNGGMYGPNGIFYNFRNFVHYLPGPTQVAGKFFIWYNGGFYLSKEYRLIRGQVRKTLPGPLATYFFEKKFFGAGGNELSAYYFQWKGASSYVVKPAFANKLYPKQFSVHYGNLLGPFGVYYNTARNVFMTLGDNSRSIPTRFVQWLPNSGFSVRASYLPKLYPAKFQHKNGGLYGPRGIVYFWNAPTNEARFFLSNGRRVPSNFFYWYSGGFYTYDNVRFVNGIPEKVQ